MQNRLRATDLSVRDNVKLTVFAIITANLAFSLSDAAIKLISANFVLWQVLYLAKSRFAQTRRECFVWR